MQYNSLFDIVKLVLQAWDVLSPNLTAFVDHSVSIGLTTSIFSSHKCSGARIEVSLISSPFRDSYSRIETFRMCGELTGIGCCCFPANHSAIMMEAYYPGMAKEKLSIL